jgi:hypothetical protein
MKSRVVDKPIKVYLPRKINPETIKYVEQSEGMKFFRKPRLKGGDFEGANATHAVEHVGERVVGASITVNHDILSKDRKKPVNVKTGTVILHELRENLYLQNRIVNNGGTERNISSTKNPLHIKANKHRAEDRRWVMRKLRKC